MYWSIAFRFALLKVRQLTNYSIRSERGEKPELAASRVLCSAIGQVDDLAVTRPLDCSVGLIDEALQPI